MKIIGRTHPGQVRPNNEDAFAFDVERGVAVLADGMGGLNAGEVASAQAVTSVLEALRDCSTLSAAAVSGAIEAANRRVYDLSRQQRELRNMGTTLVVLAAAGGGRVAVGHVGDSRAYRLSQTNVERLTRDHSVVQTMVDQGLMTADEARVATNRNIITRAIGLDADVQVDVDELPWRSGDVFLLCSDGLTDMVHDDELRRIWQSHVDVSLESLAERLVDAALAAGGYDNISVLLVGV